MGAEGKKLLCLRPTQSLPEVQDPLESVLEKSIDMALRCVPQVATDRGTASTRLSKILSLSPEERTREIALNESFPSYSIAVLALEYSEKAITHNPARAIELARLARSIVVKVNPRSCGGKAALADLHAYSMAMEGNALRVSGNLRTALQMFEAARQFQKGGGVDPDLTARVDRLESSLRRSLLQLETALSLLERAEEQFRAIKSDNQIARTIINQSNVFFVRGDFDKAGTILESALAFAHDPFLVLTIRHNTIDILARSGRPREAARLFDQTRNLYGDHATPLTTSRQLWVESVITRELGEDLDLARELMTRATNRLVDHGYDTTTAGLELMFLRSKGPGDGPLRPDD